MKQLSKILIVLIVLLCVSLIPVKGTSDYITITKTNGKTLTYKNTNIEVKFPRLESYETKETEFRGVWVSAFAGDISGYTTSKESFQEELISVLNTMEKYNLNTILFHIRTHNDALYDTRLAPKSEFIKSADFTKWDYLEWFINECHKRGIEFHAWMNPYRISSVETTMASIKKRFLGYPLNPASSENNVLIGSDGAILDPGSPVVRNYLIDVCLEVMEKYDVDAIHFDDYFYIDDVDDEATFNKYKQEFNTNDIEDFRRLQVDKFIEDLSNAMYDFNIKNNRAVQLGISPSDVYRNGTYNNNYVYDDNGTLISPLASNSTGYSHYDGPLYSDTKKWIDNEWIDYIIPQLYGSLENTAAPYADLVDWWIHVVKYKKVNLYTGIGLYQLEGNSDKGWYTKGQKTFTYELLYNSKYEEIKGACIYSYSTLNIIGNKNDDIKYVNENMWKEKAINPVSKRYNSEAADFGVNLYKGNSSYTILIDESEANKNYAIYRITENEEKLIKIIGYNNDFKKASFVDEVENNDNITYRIFPISKANVKGVAKEIKTSEALTSPKDSIGIMPSLSYSGTVSKNARIALTIKCANIIIGNDVNYILYVSLDNKEFTQVRTFKKINEFRGLEYYFNFNDKMKPNYFKVEAYNDYGNVYSEVLKVDYNRIKVNEFNDILLTIINDKIDDIINVEEQ
ncbi:MAG: family 10 glycosylhydrolase [Acholeplasmataceae bacterium]|nr:family 10 glycosylhydrolase [Acholeplasmataceae bacterium]